MPLLLLRGDPAEHAWCGATSRSSSASERASSSAPATGAPASSPACRARAATVRGSSPESDLERDPVAGEPGDRLRDVRPQLVGERDHGDRLEGGQPRAAGGVPQRGVRVGGAGERRGRAAPAPSARSTASASERRRTGAGRGASGAPSTHTPSSVRSALHRSAEEKGISSRTVPRLARAGRRPARRWSGWARRALRHRADQPVRGRRRRTRRPGAPPRGASRPVVRVPVLSVQTTSTLLTDSTALTCCTSAPRPRSWRRPTV